MENQKTYLPIHYTLAEGDFWMPWIFGPVTDTDLAQRTNREMNVFINKKPVHAFAFGDTQDPHTIMWDCRSGWRGGVPAKVLAEEFTKKVLTLEASTEFHIMVDLETLSLGAHTVVTQLGWALFDPRGDGCMAANCYHLPVEEQIEKGREISWRTIAWWLEQEDAARIVMAKGHRLPFVKTALDKFEHDIDWPKITGTWSHGLNFDIPILVDLYGDRPVPWHYRTPRDTRTLFWLAGVKAVIPTLVKHSAEADAVAQALTVQLALRNLAGMEHAKMEKANV